LQLVEAALVAERGAKRLADAVVALERGLGLRQQRVEELDQRLYTGVVTATAGRDGRREKDTISASAHDLQRRRMFTRVKYPDRRPHAADDGGMWSHESRGALP
jgi:hypothetical protein